MVSVDEAARIVFSSLFTPAKSAVAIEKAVGRVLAEPVHADRHFPPFNRVAMDGVAISFQAWQDGKTNFMIEGTQAAGEPQKTLKNPVNCLEVMTGAVLPNGTDTVIRYEDLVIADGHAKINIEKIQNGQNIHVEGADAKKGQQLLEPHVILSPAEIALLASVGKSFVNVFDYPKTAIISGGDELVDVSATPEPHQIRRSNTYAVEAAMREMGWSGEKFHLPDLKDILEQSLRRILTEYDVLILSGGVSKGKFDFIPEVLESIGINKKFHEVSQRPGKPFWFGTSSDNNKIVFALPGNPVSTYMCFYRYIKPWLLHSFGIKETNLVASLAEMIHFPPPLTYFLQVSVRQEDGKLIAYPSAGGGSGDFANLKNVTGFLQLPPNRTRFDAGEMFPYIPFRPV